MLSGQAAVFCVVLTVAWCKDLSFPPGFKFGSASAAYQVEGAWNVSDKGQSIWDYYTHTKAQKIVDGSNGDVACDSYHLWKRDVEICKDLGLHFYRFSISWPRLLPSGFINRVSDDGKKYYSDLIDELISHGIEPVVTLYHWDLPQTLQDLGGWTNPLISDWFADYARVVYSLYGDRVKTWLTINEPITMCDLSYNTGVLAPGVVSRDLGGYLCNKHVLVAHAKAWRIYDEEFKPKYHGKVSVANQLLWIESETDNAENEELAELVRQYGTGRYTHPIYSKEGGWPYEVERIIGDNCNKQGYARSRLPEFTEEEIKLIRGTYDYFAMNHYTSRIVKRAPEDMVSGFWPLTGVPDMGAILTIKPEWPKTDSVWLAPYPEGLRKQLVWLKNNYGDVPIIITENGYPTKNADREDYDRIQYYRDYLEQILLAIKEDGVNVTGYTAWTIMDNFEWMDGYQIHFGLYKVDFTDPARPRTPRLSAEYYASIIKSHSLDVPQKTTKDEL